LWTTITPTGNREGGMANPPIRYLTRIKEGVRRGDEGRWVGPHFKMRFMGKPGKGGAIYINGRRVVDKKGS